MRPFLPALALALAIIATSPFMGLLRDVLFAWFGAGLPRLLAGVLALAALVVVWKVVLRVRGDRDACRRRRRWALLAAVAVLLVAQTLGFSTDDLSVDVVEKIHIFEYGLLALLLYRGVRLSPGLGPVELLALPVLGGALGGVLDEATQGYFQLRTGDIRDVVLNAIAAVCGLLLALALDPPSSDEPGRGTLFGGWTFRGQSAGGRPARPRYALLGALGGALVLASGLFFARFHLGHEIHDEQVGRFRSWFDAEQLRALSAERARSWQRNPPTGLVAWHAEDYYLTEAAWHANHRNERQSAGDAYMALAANRILETYYAPFLELESFRGSGRHRWDPDLVADLEARLAAEHGESGPPPPGEAYSSPVLRQRIHTWPPEGPFRLATLLLAAGLLALGSWLDRSRASRPRTGHGRADD